MRYFEKKPLAITVFSGAAALTLAVIIKSLSNDSPKLFFVLVGVFFWALFVISLVFYVLYLSAYSRETRDSKLWDFGLSAAAKRIPLFYSGAYKRNILALNFYLWLILAFLCSAVLLLL